MILGLLVAIRRYYDRIDETVEVTGAFTVEETAPPTILLAIDERTRMSDRALRFAMTLSPDVIAIHLLSLAGPEEDGDGEALRKQWQIDVVALLKARGVRPPPLMMLNAPFREIHEPMLALIAKIDAETPGRSVALLIPELVKRRWWERILHTNRAEQLRRMLMLHGGDRVTVIIVPWRA